MDYTIIIIVLVETLMDVSMKLIILINNIIPFIVESKNNVVGIWKYFEQKLYLDKICPLLLKRILVNLVKI